MDCVYNSLYQDHGSKEELDKKIENAIKIGNYMRLWWLIEGNAGCGTVVENFINKSDKEMEEHFFQMKETFDEYYL